MRAELFVWELDAAYDSATMHWPMFQHDLRRSGHYTRASITGDLADLAALLASYNTCEGDPLYNPIADIDGDGCIALSDLAALLANYGVGT